MGKRRPVTRRCSACGGELDKYDAFRIVRSSDGIVKIDPTGRYPGRGVYLCKKISCCLLAKKKASLSRCLKCDVPMEIIESLILALGKSDEKVGIDEE